MSRLAKAKTSRRGAYLLLVGSIYVIIGSSLVLMPLSNTAESSYQIATNLAPIQVWGSLWVLAGLVGVVTAWWPPDRDIWGFSTMAGFSSGWAAMALLSTVMEGSDRGWILALIWGQFAAALMIVSGMDRVRE